MSSLTTWGGLLFFSLFGQSAPPLPGVAAGIGAANHVDGSHPGSAIAKEFDQHITRAKGSKTIFFFFNIFIFLLR